jgi:DNA-binding NarL/FixJ family response regulator
VERSEVKMGRPPRRLVIQDRSRLFAESLQIALRPALAPNTISCVRDGEALLASLAGNQPDGVILEVGGVPWDVLALVGQVTDNLRHTVIVGTMPLGEHRTLGRGPEIVVTRTASSRTFARALRGLSPHVPSSPKGPGSAPEVPARLTQREYQVLSLIARGLTTMEIGKRLGISPKTVQNRRQSLFSKLEVQNQSHAISVAVRAGLLGPNSYVDGDS